MKLKSGLLLSCLFRASARSMPNSGSGKTDGHKEHHTKNHSEMKEKRRRFSSE